MMVKKSESLLCKLKKQKTVHTNTDLISFPSHLCLIVSSFSPKTFDKLNM